MRRLDMLFNALWDKARNGDLQAVDRILKIMDSQERLLSLSKQHVELGIAPDTLDWLLSQRGRCGVQ